MKLGLQVQRLKTSRGIKPNRTEAGHKFSVYSVALLSNEQLFIWVGFRNFWSLGTCLRRILNPDD